MVQRAFVFGLVLTALPAIGCSSSRDPAVDAVTAAGPASVSSARLTSADAELGQEATPLVVDGVPYVSTAWSKVKA